MDDRLIELVNWYGSSDRKRFSEFSEKTGISRDTIKNLYHKKQRVNQEHIEAICQAFPEFKYWFVFGETNPELGQISPDIESTRQAYAR